MILAGDVGGTRTRLGLFDVENGTLKPVWKQTVLNVDYTGISDVLARTDALRGVAVEASCFGAAGPVENGVCRMTNLDWTLDAAALTASAGIGVVKVVNDLTAIAVAVAHMPDESFVVLQTGSHPWGMDTMAVVAPGTGLGEAGLLEPEERPARELTLKGAQAMGTPFISLFSPEEIVAMAQDAGFRETRHVSTSEMTARYFAGRIDGLRPSSAEEMLVAVT